LLFVVARLLCWAKSFAGLLKGVHNRLPSIRNTISGRALASSFDQIRAR
jgi:hypothetical protein